MSHRSAILFVSALLCTASALSAQGQILPPSAPAADGISVYGTGEALERPNLIEIDLHISGKAELTGDALVKHRDAKSRLLEALGKLNLAGASIDEHGLSINVGTGNDAQQRIINGMPQTPGKPQVDVASTVRIRLTDARTAQPEDLFKTIGRILDVAQDAGVSVGPTPAELTRNMRLGLAGLGNSPVRFVLTDLAELREKAYEKAVADAADRAGRLAKLHHVKVGQALSIQEVAVGGDASAAAANPQVAMLSVSYGVQTAQPADTSSEPRIVSNTLTGVPVQVKLLVRFAIHPADPATAQQ